MPAPAKPSKLSRDTTVKSVALTVDGSQLVTGSLDKTARLWDARRGVKLQEFKGGTGGVECVAPPAG